MSTNVKITIIKGGSTLVLKSEGVVKEHQADVLGVYRMIDSYNERPVYKQVMLIMLLMVILLTVMVVMMLCA